MTEATKVHHTLFGIDIKLSSQWSAQLKPHCKRKTYGSRMTFLPTRPIVRAQLPTITLSWCFAVHSANLSFGLNEAHLLCSSSRSFSSSVFPIPVLDQSKLDNVLKQNARHTNADDESPAHGAPP